MQSEDMGNVFEDEEMEVVELLGQTALFTNGRVPADELPAGLYKYDLREGENISFATVEKFVAVNHGGTFLVKEPLEFNGQEYLELDDDTAPNFLGYSMSPKVFANTDFTPEAGIKQSGGMQL